VLTKVSHFEIKYNLCSISLHSTETVTMKNVPAYLFILYSTLITSETNYNRNELDV